MKESEREKGSARNSVDETANERYAIISLKILFEIASTECLSDRVHVCRGGMCAFANVSVRNVIAIEKRNE